MVLIGDLNRRSSTRSDAEEERGNGGERGRKRESSSWRRGKGEEKERKRRREYAKEESEVKDGDFGWDSDDGEKDRLIERDRDKKRFRDVVEEKDRDIDSDDSDGEDRVKSRYDKKNRGNYRLEERDRGRNRDVGEEKAQDVDINDGDRVRSRDDKKRKKNHGKERDRVKKNDRDIFKKKNDRDRDSEDGDRVKIRDDKRSRNIDKERDSVDKKREREWERERERKKRIREKEERARRKGKERERESDGSDGEEDGDGKRRRRDGDRKEKERDRRRKRHRENSEDDSVKINERESLLEKKKETTREEDMEEEQRVLHEEMEKRRRRVQEWQELRKKEESERDKEGEGDDIESRKKWTLEGESDDDEGEGVDKADTDVNIEENDKSEVAVENGMDIDSRKGEKSESLVQNGGAGDMDEDEIDPLDAFMNSMILPEVENLTNNAPFAASNEMKIDSKRENASNGKIVETVKKAFCKSIGRIIPGEESESDYEEDEDTLEDENDEEFLKRVKTTKVDKLVMIDHSKIVYPPFRKNFYKDVKEISRMSSEEVSNCRKELELKLHGKDIPNPVLTWHQIGLSTKVLDTIKKQNFEKPMPVQAQALPIIMSGRDCIGVAKTGSGKTLAFVLPMLRHIKDQPPLMSGDGPIALIMAPTRELVRQIHSDIKKFIKSLGITCVAVYGGSGVAQQIGELKRGAEIVVCTPGRMIDILCTSAGKITNLRRVTYLVMDEADRMFDMGFEPQITRIVQNIRPDRQTVLFSATFPHSVETLAKKVLHKNAVQIQIGGRSVVNKDITQFVEVRPEEERFLRLLELLGVWYEKGKILIFVESKEKCDALFKYLLGQGYPCLSLHGGKEQTDRESTISDFKSNVCNLLVATSVASRGLDVKDLELVINFDVPNHYEDYVHRVGRTGRAGRKGCAITFISEGDAKYAPGLLKALQLSDQVVPDDVKALADGFTLKVNQGLEKDPNSGYKGNGFKFNEAEEEAKKAEKKAQAKQFGFEEDKSDSDDENEGVRKAGEDLSQQVVLAQAAAFAAASKATLVSSIETNQGTLPDSLQGVASAALPGGDGAARAAALAAAMNLQHTLAKIQANAMPEHYEAELEINELPQNARLQVMYKETLRPISELTGAAITTRGQYFPPGTIVGPGDRKLYLFIEGPNEKSVKMAKAELKHALERIMQGTQGQTGKYSVL